MAGGDTGPRPPAANVLCVFGDLVIGWGVLLPSLSLSVFPGFYNFSRGNPKLDLVPLAPQVGLHVRHESTSMSPTSLTALYKPPPRGAVADRQADTSAVSDSSPPVLRAIEGQLRLQNTALPPATL